MKKAPTAGPAYPTLLAAFLAKKKLKQVEFAAMSGIRKESLHKYVRGLTRAGLAVALRIERATKGAVPITYWEHFEPLQPQKKPKRGPRAA